MELRTDKSTGKAWWRAAKNTTKNPQSKGRIFILGTSGRGYMRNPSPCNLVVLLQCVNHVLKKRLYGLFCIFGWFTFFLWQLLEIQKSPIWKDVVFIFSEFSALQEKTKDIDVSVASNEDSININKKSKYRVSCFHCRLLYWQPTSSSMKQKDFIDCFGCLFCPRIHQNSSMFLFEHFLFL